MEDVTFDRYDTADYLKTETDIAAYLEAVMEENGNDPACIARVTEAVARARKTICVAP
jgi:probable addiction module antidote protein